MSSCAFTVFTATYNRRTTLPGVYESLCAQTFQDFEWVIVDDGSTDETGELVDRWKGDAPFPIRYFYQSNQGKHVASNRGVREARGELFLFFDSDDRCVPEALATFKHHWDHIPAERRNEFSTITALCMHENGDPIGPDFPALVTEVASPAKQMKYRRAVERWGVNRTDVLRKFPFPEVAGEKFIAEGIVWTRISLQYKTLFINERLRIFTPRADGLSASSIRLRMKNAVGASLCYREQLHPALPISWRVRDAINYCRFSFHAHIGLSRLVNESNHAFLVSSSVPIGFLVYCRDRLQHSRDNGL